MIKLQNILSEALNKKEIMGIVKKVYPHIAKDLGSKMVPVEVHNNIYKRLDAVGIEDLMKQNNPSAQYDWDKKKIYLYYTSIPIHYKIKIGISGYIEKKVIITKHIHLRKKLKELKRNGNVI